MVVTILGRSHCNSLKFRFIILTSTHVLPWTVLKYLHAFGHVQYTTDSKCKGQCCKIVKMFPVGQGVRLIITGSVIQYFTLWDRKKCSLFAYQRCSLKKIGKNLGPEKVFTYQRCSLNGGVHLGRFYCRLQWSYVLNSIFLRNYRMDF